MTMDINLPIVAGTVSTLIFALSTLPMLRKAFRTKDLASYSLGQIGLANGGNAIHSLYVFSLPPGPIWMLHAFYLVTTGVMLFWYLRYEGVPQWPLRRAEPRYPASAQGIPGPAVTPGRLSRSDPAPVRSTT
jgi:uncharacterized protein with PQ loop repeat